MAKELDFQQKKLSMPKRRQEHLRSIHETVFENDGDPITLLDQISIEDSKWFEKLSLEEAIQHLDERETYCLSTLL